MPGPHTLLSVRGLSKHFGGTKALQDVDFTVNAGEIHALLGENGAGKSTLIKILAGIHAPDAGTVVGPSEPLRPGHALEGIAFVHQDLGLVDTLRVEENVALGAGFARRGPLIDWRETRRLAAQALAAMDLAISPSAITGHLGAAEKSMVVIARALTLNASIIVLDEPTATLHQSDVVRLQDTLRRLAKRGLGIVYVTHRLDEVFEIADTVTVLRDGKVTHAGPVGETTPQRLVEDIIGRSLGAMFPARPATTGPPLLRVEGLRSKLAGPVDFTLHAGEILGLVGLRNSGQDTIGRLLVGALPARGGRVLLGDAPLDRSAVRGAVRGGLGFVSSKRQEESLCPSLNLRENVFMDPGLSGGGAINTPAEQEKATATLKAFGVRPPEPDRVIATLSGGNQQKVVLARWLGVGRRVMVLEEPTIGVDVGARAEIYRLLAEAAEEGLGTVVVSSDFEEVAGLCDRALVFDRGKVVAELGRKEITVERLTRIAGGAAGEIAA